MVNWGLLSQLTLAISVVIQAYLLFSANSLSFPFSSLSNPQRSLQAPPTTSPYASSWGSWLHPQSTRKSYDVGVGTEGRGQGGGAIGRDWNILYHLGGNGPWVEKVDGIVEGGIGVPDGCRVEQVHMMSRHSERFPTIRPGVRMLELVKRIQDANISLKGDLEFVNRWNYFTFDPQAHFEQLTTTGPFAGTLEAFTTGVKLRT
ncbi:hypothetical protein B0A49_12081, partial [Cryomyces minteri]